MVAPNPWPSLCLYSDSTMSAMASQITGVSIVCLTVCAVADQKSHSSDVIMSAIASQITSFSIVYSTVWSGADQRKHQFFVRGIHRWPVNFALRASTAEKASMWWRHYGQSSASLAFMRGIRRWPVDSPHKGPVTRKMFPFDDVIIAESICFTCYEKYKISFFLFLNTEMHEIDIPPLGRRQGPSWRRQETGHQKNAILLHFLLKFYFYWLR